MHLLCMPRLWLERVLDCEKRLPHPSTSHAYGRSPMCVSLWLESALDTVKRLPQPRIGRICEASYRFGRHAKRKLEETREGRYSMQYLCFMKHETTIYKGTNYLYPSILMSVLAT